MTKRANSIRFVGQVTQRHEADDHLREAGAAVLVHRGVDRSLAMQCPDGCGEILTINLDPRTGPAWRIYQDGPHGVSLFPSVWRDTGCKSHFIVWRSRVYWCDWHEELEATDAAFETRVLSALGTGWLHYTAIANTLGVVPWAVLSACNRLCRKNLVQAGLSKQQGYFRKV